MERDDAVQALSKFAKVMPPTVIPGEWSKVRRFWDHLRSSTTKRPFTFYEYASARFGAMIDTALTKHSPQAVHVDSLDLYAWLPKVAGLPIVCTHHSVESELVWRRGKRTRQPALRWYIKRQAHMLEHVERVLCPKMRANIVVSDKDGKRLREIAPGCQTATIPNGVDTEYFLPQAGPTHAGRVLFLGPLYMFANRDAVDFFLEEAWPTIRSARPDATLDLVGRATEVDRTHYGTYDGVRVVGFVEDIRPCLAAAQCGIVPIQAGGGTRLKILDLWAMGKAVISTSIGCEGLDARHGENILIGDDAADFAEAVIRVLDDGDYRSMLGENARASAEQTYAWDLVGLRIRNLYHDILSGDRKVTANPP